MTEIAEAPSTENSFYKIHFRKQPLFRGNFLRCRYDIFRFFEFILDPLQFVVHGSPVFIQSNK